MEQASARLSFSLDARFIASGCFNKSIWDPATGRPFTQETIDKIIKTSSPYWCEGLSILGGEPTAEWNVRDVVILCKAFKEAYPHKDIWLWTGRFFGELEKDVYAAKLLKIVDVIIDGPFIESLKDLSKKWRGSSNQRIWRRTGDKWDIISDPMI